MLWTKLLTPTLSCRERAQAKEVVYGWTRGQSCPDYGRWGYERHRSSYSAQAGSAGCGLALTDLQRPPEDLPPGEIKTQWRGIDSVAEEVEAHGRRCLRVWCDLQ